MKPDLSKPSKLLRANVARGITCAVAQEDSPVIRDGGDYGAGLIRGVAAITRGEALGHGFWVDSEMVGQTVAAINASSNGIKSRFAHPGLSGDGVGKVLGRLKNATRDGDIARADLHLFATAHNAPDGDLADYTMGLAEEDPEAFGTSIVFEPDVGEEDRYAVEFTNDDGDFISPDPDNKNNYRHARIGKLWACDVVDEPAANPGGMFSRGQEVAYEANALLEYAIGLNDTPPAIEELGVDPTRVRHFWGRFLDTHDNVVVTILQESKHMANSATTSDAQSVKVDADALRSEGAQAERTRFAALARAFKSPKFVAEMFDAGKTAEQAQPLWLQRENERLAAENAKLRAKLEEQEEEDEELENGEDEEKPDDEMMEGEEEEEKLEDEEKPEESRKHSQARPAKFSARASGSSKPDFMSLARDKAKADGIRIDQAMSALAKEQPALHAAFVANGCK